MSQMISYGDGETHASILESEGLKLTVPLSELLQGKTTCLFFSAKSCRPCRTFTPQLLHLYNSIDRRKLEIILVSLDKDEASFSDHAKNMPWLIPAAAHDRFDTSRRLCARYRVRSIPSLVPLASDGITVEEDAVWLVEEYGVDAFPFDANTRYQLEAMDDAKRRGGDLQQLLSSSSTPSKQQNKNNYVISRDHGKQIPVADLVGKSIGLYFGARWCPPCRTFTTMLLETYNDHIVKSGSGGSSRGFEIIFISLDRDEEEFKLSLEEMPWLAVPYLEVQTRKDICRIYDVKSIPQLLLLQQQQQQQQQQGPDHGKSTLSTDQGRSAMIFSSSKLASCFPAFTEEEEEEEELRKEEGDGTLPCQVTDPRHVHTLKLDTAKAYVCDACRRQGRYRVFSCRQCDFDLHPACIKYPNRSS